MVRMGSFGVVSKCTVVGAYMMVVSSVLPVASLQSRFVGSNSRKQACSQHSERCLLCCWQGWI